jgi:hypothetical protein
MDWGADGKIQFPPDKVGHVGWVARQQNPTS